MRRAHLVESLCIDQDPPNFNDLGRILCNVHTMFVAGRGHVDDNIAVNIQGSWRESRHVELVVVGSSGRSRSSGWCGRRKLRPIDLIQLEDSD